MGDITIPNASTLTIEPGVDVVFYGHYKLNVQGQLFAVGSSSDSILFTTSDSLISWAGIRFNYTPASNDTSKISYCVIERGHASGSGDESKGGAFYIKNFTKVLLTNSTLQNNKSDDAGGGISIINGWAKITSNLIMNNTAGSHGAGIYCHSSSIPIHGNTITGNHSTGWWATGGGLMLWYGSNGSLIDNTISNNYAYQAGGMFLQYNSNVYISDNIIDNNSAYINGGGIIISGTGPIVTNNVISNNYLNYGWANGGGIYVDGNGNAMIRNNFIVNNLAPLGGGGINCVSSNAKIINNLICNNQTSNWGEELASAEALL